MDNPIFEDHGFFMPLVIRAKSYLWRPVEIQSLHSPEKIEQELPGRIIKESECHSAPSYGKLFGTAGNGEFSISFVPLSSLFTKGMGQVSLRGKIERQGRGSRIHVCLMGPSLGIWILVAIALVFPCFFLISKGLLRSPWLTLQTIDWIPFMIVELILALFTGVMFGADRLSNREGEGKILEVLKEAAG